MTSFCCQMPWILTGFLGNLCRRRAKFIDVRNIGLRFDRRCNRSPRRLLSYCSRCSDRFCSDHRNVCSVTVSQKITKLLLARLNGRICVGCPTSVRPLLVPYCKQTPAMRVINRLRRSQCLTTPVHGVTGKYCCGRTSFFYRWGDILVYIRIKFGLSPIASSSTEMWQKLTISNNVAVYNVIRATCKVSLQRGSVSTPHTSKPLKPFTFAFCRGSIVRLLKFLHWLQETH